MKWIMRQNIERLECDQCEGIFSEGEPVVETDESKFCEACYEENRAVGLIK